MTQHQLLKTNSSLLTLMRSNSMRVKDVDLISMIDEANEMESNGEQKSYIVQYLADKYHLSVRSIYTAIDRLNSEICL